MPRYELLLEAPARVRITVEATSFTDAERQWALNNADLSVHAFEGRVEIDIDATRLIAVFRPKDSESN